MLLLGLPFTEQALSHTRTGGTPYGASHVAGHDNNVTLSEDEKQLAIAQGRRLAEAARKLAA
ncbi:NAD(P)H dehydrogenase (quinone) [compost metagenome]